MTSPGLGGRDACEHHAANTIGRTCALLNANLDVRRCWHGLEQVVDNVKMVAQARGLALKDHMGRNLYTGNIWRIGGSRHLIRRLV